MIFSKSLGEHSFIHKTIGPLHDVVIWYKIRHIRTQKNVTASKTKHNSLKKCDFFCFTFPGGVFASQYGVLCTM